MHNDKDLERIHMEIGINGEHGWRESTGMQWEGKDYMAVVMNYGRRRLRDQGLFTLCCVDLGFSLYMLL